MIRIAPGYKPGIISLMCEVLLAMRFSGQLDVFMFDCCLHCGRLQTHMHMIRELTQNYPICLEAAHDTLHEYALWSYLCILGFAACDLPSLGYPPQNGGLTLHTANIASWADHALRRIDCGTDVVFDLEAPFYS